MTTGRIELAEGVWPPVPQQRPRQQSASSKADVTGDQIASSKASSDVDRPDMLIFDWMKPVAAAAFVRAGYLWVVFDEPDAELLQALPLPPLSLDDGEIVQADGGTAIRYRMNEPVGFQTTQPEEGRWRIDPTSEPLRTQAISIERIDDAGILRLTPIQNSQIVSMIDPAVGDRIKALPVLEAGLRQPVKQRFVDLELLPTSQGLAWRPLNDQLNMHIDDQALIFTKPRGLSISNTGTKTARAPKRVVKSAAQERRADDDDVSSKIVRPASRSNETQPSSSTVAPQRPSYLGFAGSGVDRTGKS